MKAYLETKLKDCRNEIINQTAALVELERELRLAERKYRITQDWLKKLKEQEQNLQDELEDEQ